MTTQAELLELAEANRKFQPAIDVVLQSIQEAQANARVALGAMQDIAKRREGVDFLYGFCVMLDNSDVVATASKAATAMTLIATNLTTLAVLLQQAGLDVSY
jgi:hypothetical protein